jgi:hypothetical protein
LKEWRPWPIEGTVVVFFMMMPETAKTQDNQFRNKTRHQTRHHCSSFLGDDVMTMMMMMICFTGQSKNKS